MTEDAPTAEALVVASYGRRFQVETGGEQLDCVTRGRRTDLACGDRVIVQRTGGGGGIIQQIQPRTSLLYRSDAYREKLIAANVTQAVIVAAGVPPPHEGLIDRCLAAAEHNRLRIAIALNKSDLAEHAAALHLLEGYAALGYRVVSLNAKQDLEPLSELLHGHVSVLVGQSGVGKSTIINRLVPHAAARTDAVSHALGSGKHTTTHTRLYHLDGHGEIIDSPGMQTFGLHHLDLEDLVYGFIEFRPLVGQCRFRDCHHVSEPGCALQFACDEKHISARRLASYRALLRERQAPGVFSGRARRPR